MPAPPEPHRDHRTIGSFKRTFNAAVLLLVSRRTPPVLRVPGVVVLGLVVLAGHDHHVLRALAQMF
jgi:hypothetical protein